MENKDSEILEDIAEVLVQLDHELITDSGAIKKIMKIVSDNSTEKLKRYLDSNLKERN